MIDLYARPGSGGQTPTLPALPINAGARITEAGDSIPDGFFGGGQNAAYACFLPLRTTLSAVFTGAGKLAPVHTKTAVSGQTTSAMLAGINAQILTTSPNFVLVVIGANNVGFGVTPEQTFIDTSSIISTTIASFPSCVFHWFGCPMRSSEKWPDGTSADSAGVLAVNSAMQQAVARFPNSARYWNLRQYAFSLEPQLNTPSPGVDSGFLTTDGTHPTKQGDRPAGQSGAEVYSAFAYQVIGVNLT